MARLPESEMKFPCGALASKENGVLPILAEIAEILRTVLSAFGLIFCDRDVPLSREEARWRFGPDAVRASSLDGDAGVY
jgi:hypothetical protein